MTSRRRTAAPSEPAGTFGRMRAGDGAKRRRGGEGSLAGRLVLLFGAYAPVAIIIAARVIPRPIGWAALALGVAGVGIWITFLLWLRGHQPRDARVSEVEPIDDD